MTNFEEAFNRYTDQDLERRKDWYSDAAEAYALARPRYPEALVARATELARLKTGAAILEVGCGPGTATTAFAAFGLSMLCLEPNSKFARLAERNCGRYPNVEVHNLPLEVWELAPGFFDAVLAATSIHWIPKEIRYAKTAAALKDGGALILLWNMQMQPKAQVHSALQGVFETFAPALGKFETRQVQEANLESFAQDVLASGLFDRPTTELRLCEATYSAQEYLLLLSSYSPYIELEVHRRASLFEGLREKIVHEFGDSLKLSYLSALQVAHKREP